MNLSFFISSTYCLYKLQFLRSKQIFFQCCLLTKLSKTGDSLLEELILYSTVMKIEFSLSPAVPESCAEIALLCALLVSISVGLGPLKLQQSKPYVFFLYNVFLTTFCEIKQTESWQYYSTLTKNRVEQQVKGESQMHLGSNTVIYVFRKHK